MELKLIKYPDPRLRQKCESFIPPEIEKGRAFLSELNYSVGFEELADAMLDLCIQARGVGLSAPQVGIMRRFIVVNSGKYQLAIINPSITSTTGRSGQYEGCLSYPGKKVYVTRHRIVTVQGFNAAGQPLKLRANGQLSTILQHEIDHLNGVCAVAPKEFLQ